MNIENEIEIRNSLWRRLSTGFRQFNPTSLAHAFTNAFSRLKICQEGCEYVLRETECSGTDDREMTTTQKKTHVNSEHSLAIIQCLRQAFCCLVIRKQSGSYNFREMENADSEMYKLAKVPLDSSGPSKSSKSKRLVSSCQSTPCQNTNGNSLTNAELLDQLGDLEARVQQQNAVLQKYRSRPMENDKHTVTKDDGFLSNSEMLTQLEKLESRFKKQADIFQKYRASVPTAMSKKNNIHAATVTKETGCTNGNAQLLTKQAAATEFLTNSQIQNQLESLEARFKQQSEIFDKYRSRVMGNQGDSHTVTMATVQSRRPWFTAQKEAAMSTMVVRMMASWEQGNTGS